MKAVYTILISCNFVIHMMDMYLTLNFNPKGDSTALNYRRYNFIIKMFTKCGPIGLKIGTNTHWDYAMKIGWSAIASAH
jgi:hypothetical protein